MSTFYIDKDDGGYVMFRDTREKKNEIAYAKAGVLGEFVKMFAATLDMQKDGESIVIEVKRI